MKTIVMTHPMHKILQFLFLHSLFFLITGIRQGAALIKYTALI